MIYHSLIENNKLKIDIRNEDFISNFAYPVISSNRDKIVEELIENGVEVRPLIAGNMANNPFWYKKYGKVKLDNADLIDDEGFYVPNHHELERKDIELIASIINKHNK
tara:strand:- start:8904 stop:9227 length:324 start_codon:yes stop_codon:yes gene_type:complete